MFLKFLSTSLIIFSKYYHYTFLTLFILINIIFFSEEISLGVKEEFILFKTIGVFRSSIFFALISITLSLLALLILLKMLFMQKHYGISNKNILGKAFKIYVFLTFIISSILFLYDGQTYQFNSFVWTSFATFPIVVNDIFDNILKYDFHTISLINTPKIILAKILELPTLFGISWYDSIYFYDVLINIIHLPLLFIFISNISNQFFKGRSDNYTNIFFYTLIFLLCSSGLIDKLQPDQSLMGWESAFKNLQTDAKHFSLIFGLIFICNFFGKDFGSFKILTLISLLICTLVHVLYGLAFFSLMVLYFISLKKFDSLKLIIFYFGLGFVLPSIILLIFTKNPNPLDPKKFIEINNLTIHSFHYKISELIGWTFFKWLVCYLFYLMVAIKAKDRLLIRLSLFSLIFFIAPSLIQLLGTEVFKIKVIGILGLNRFTTFNSMIFCVNTLIMIGRLKYISSLKLNLQKTLSTLIQDKRIQTTKNEKFLLQIVHNSFANWKFIVFSSLVTILAIWGSTIHDPLNQIKFQKKNYTVKLKSLPSLCNWIRYNTKENSIIFVEDLINNKPFLNFTENMALSMAIKCFGQRATFVDLAFPFNESSLLEWSERKYYYRNLDLLDSKELNAMIKKYSITHFLFDVNKTSVPHKFKKVWESEKFALLEVNAKKN